MSCFHPNIVTYYPLGYKYYDSSKKDWLLVRNKDGSVKHWKFQGAGFEKVLDDGSIIYELEGKNKGSYVRQIGKVSIAASPGEFEYSMAVPCQQCVGCRIDYSRHWADRIVMESLLYPEHTNFFVTLTYNDDNIYLNYTGETIELLIDGQYQTVNAATLIREDVQLFLKRLREKYSRDFDHTGIRVYYCGEYGSRSRRPHYHLCLFNCPIPDLKPYSRNFQGDLLYNSPMFESLWGKGYVVIGELTWETAAYTARYVVKKFKGKKADEFYQAMGNVLPEFSHSSNRPGIAAKYFEENKEKIYKYDRIVLPGTEKRDGSVTVPRYFDKLLERYQEEHPDDQSIERLEKIKFQRRAASELKKYNERILCGTFDKEYFRLKEAAFNKRVAGLQRTLDI